MFVFLCLSPDSLSRSHSRTLESLEVIPQHDGPITMERHNIIRLYLLKVNPPTRSDVLELVSVSRSFRFSLLAGV